MVLEKRAKYCKSRSKTGLAPQTNKLQRRGKLGRSSRCSPRTSNHEPRPPFMADFKRHVTCSCLTGVVFGGVAYHLNVPPATCLVTAGLSGIAGMLPDIDSDTSRSHKTCLAMAAVLGGMMTVQRLRVFELDQDLVIFLASCVFFSIIYIFGAILRKMTAHRGMFHSLPAAVIAMEIVYIASEGSTQSRIVKALGLGAGYLSHLVLDEIYSFDSTGKVFRIKKSFGTAIKMIDYNHTRITAMVYAVAIFLGTLISNEDLIVDELGLPDLKAVEEVNPAPEMMSAMSVPLGATEPKPKKQRFRRMKKLMGQSETASTDAGVETHHFGSPVSPSTVNSPLISGNPNSTMKTAMRSPVVVADPSPPILIPRDPVDSETELFQRRKGNLQSLRALSLPAETSPPPPTQETAIPISRQALQSQPNDSANIPSIPQQMPQQSSQLLQHLTAPSTLYRGPDTGLSNGAENPEPRPLGGDRHPFRRGPLLQNRGPAPISLSGGEQ